MILRARRRGGFTGKGDGSNFDFLWSGRGTAEARKVSRAGIGTRIRYIRGKVRYLSSFRRVN